MPVRRISGQILTLWQFQVAFIGFEQKYDIAIRSALFKLMNWFVIHSMLINRCQIILNNTWYCFKAARLTIEKFQDIIFSAIMEQNLGT